MMIEIPSTALETAETLRDFCLLQLNDAGKKPRHPWRLATLALCDQNGSPLCMKIVLRDFHKGTLTFFTDQRSAKIQSLEAKPEVSLCFYNADLGLQFTALCSVGIHHQDLICQAYWKKLSESSKTCYTASPSPGAALKQPFSFSNQDSCELPYDNFAVIKCAIRKIDILCLNPKGNIRAMGDFAKPSSITWAAP